MKDLARSLRQKGLTFSEISKELKVNVRKVRVWTEDIKLPKNQIVEKIRRIKIESAKQKYEKNIIDKEELEKTIRENGFYKAIKKIGLTEGSARYWCNKYNIEIKTAYKRKYSYEKCCICNKIYEDYQCKKKICNTCVSKLRRMENKILAIEYLGGKCKKCNYTKTEENYAAFEFHHPQDNKEIEIGEILNKKWETIEKELKKCELLCSNCHRISHSSYLNTVFIKVIKDKYTKEDCARKEKILFDKNNATVIKVIKENRSSIIINEEEIKNLVKTDSAKKIADKFNVSQNTIRRICKEKNIEIPKKHYLQKKFNVNKEDLCELIKTNPIYKIALIFGVSDNAIRKRCRSLEINWKSISPFSHGKKITT